MLCFVLNNNFLYVAHDGCDTVMLQVSAYSSFARMGVGIGLELQRRRLDSSTNEPLFTHCTRDFIGTLDYIFYTGYIFPTCQLFAST